MIDKQKTGKIISELRKEKGWSVQEFAVKINVQDKTVYKWESGKGLPDTDMYPILSKVFGVFIEYLMPETEEAKEQPEKAKIDVNKEVEKYKPLCVQYGILILDELIKIKNLEIIKEFLDNYPISYQEILSDMLQKKQLKELYRFAVDFGDETLAATVILGDEQKIRRQISIHYSLHNHSDDDFTYPYYGKTWLTKHIKELPESKTYNKPTTYDELIALQQLNGKYFITNEELTKQHLPDILSEMEEYNG